MGGDSRERVESDCGHRPCPYWGFYTEARISRNITEIFGIYSFAASFVLVTSSLPNFGMSSALLHRAAESEGEEPLRVHFTILLVFNLVWAAIIALIGALIFPQDYRWVLWVFLATQFADNLVVTSRTLLVRRVIF